MRSWSERLVSAGLVLALTGCAGTWERSALLDSLGVAMASRGSGVALSASERADMPYAAQLLALGEAPRLLIVLGSLAGTREGYASSDGRLIVLVGGRVVETDGLGTDIRLHRLPPSPAAARSSRTPVCWSSAWSARGERFSTPVLLKGCLRAGQPGPDGLLPVHETVVVSGHPSADYENLYWLDPTGHVVASRQQPGPLLPAWTLEQVKAAPLGTPAADVPGWSAGEVALTLRGALHRDPILTQGRLSAVTGPLAARHDIDWSRSRLFRTDAATLAPLLARRDALLAELPPLLAQARSRQQHSQVVALVRLQRELPAWALGRPVAASTLNPQRLAFAPDLDLALRGEAYTLLLAGERLSLPSASTPAPRLPQALADSLAVLRQHRVAAP